MGIKLKEINKAKITEGKSKKEEKEKRKKERRDRKPGGDDDDGGVLSMMRPIYVEDIMMTTT